MSFGELVFVAALAALGLCAGLGAALRRWLRHRRTSRLSRFALEQGAPLEEGPTLVVGRVEHDGESLDDPAADPALDRVERGTTFWLAMPSGARVQLRLDEDRWSYDATFTPTASGRLLVADLHAGDSVCVRGRLVREIDRSTTGAGYRNPSLAWVVRPDASGIIEVMAHSELVRHASRARYHAAWLATLALGGAWIHTRWLGQVYRCLVGSSLGAGLPRSPAVGTIVAGTLASWALVAAYELHRQRTSPWVFRRL